MKKFSIISAALAFCVVASAAQAEVEHDYMNVVTVKTVGALDNIGTVCGSSVERVPIAQLQDIVQSDNVDNIIMISGGGNYSILASDAKVALNENMLHRIAEGLTYGFDAALKNKENFDLEYSRDLIKGEYNEQISMKLDGTKSGKKCAGFVKITKFSPK
ncbi:MAG: hypothetical protein COB76_02895 [Alphaproteobacteria bacterium]|nr:MAG: hypothetical protein COB76_02895 [Alphaproteobacteria bacterium]